MGIHASVTNLRISKARRANNKAVMVTSNVACLLAAFRLLLRLFTAFTATGRWICGRGWGCCCCGTPGVTGVVVGVV